MESPDFHLWSERVTHAISILDLLEELENVFDEPAYLCDTKPEHFGLGKYDRIKILDVDHLHLKSVAGKNGLTDNRERKEIANNQYPVYLRFESRN